jgi:transcription initiation factor TFIID subunit 6
MSPSPFELRTRAADVLAKLVNLYAKGYPGLVPRLLSTLKKALTASPFPSPLGADYPPAGRYEGAVLGIGACGVHAVREALWGNNGDGLRPINDLIGLLYPGDGRKNKAPLVRATMKALSQLTTPKPDGATVPPPDANAVAEAFGPHFVRAFEKRPWQAQELMHLRNGSNGDAGAAEADAAGEEDDDMEEVQA